MLQACPGQQLYGMSFNNKRVTLDRISVLICRSPRSKTDISASNVSIKLFQFSRYSATLNIWNDPLMKAKFMTRSAHHCRPKYLS